MIQNIIGEMASYANHYFISAYVHTYITLCHARAHTHTITYIQTHTHIHPSMLSANGTCLSVRRKPTRCMIRTTVCMRARAHVRVRVRMYLHIHGNIDKGAYRERNTDTIHV